jgi:glycosyltransferase involved in cell wall biosynthesis
MIRILRVHNRLVVGGPLTHVSELSLKLPAEYETLLVAGKAEPHERDVSNQLRDNGLKIRVIPSLRRSPGLFRDIIAFLKICALIREFRPQVIHSHGAKSGFLARLAGRIMKVPVIVHTYHGHTFHSYFRRWKGWFYLALERFANQKADALIVLSPGQKDEICEHYRVCESSKTHVIPLGFVVNSFIQGRDDRRQEFRQRFDIAPDEPLVGWIGRMVAVKDPLLFVDAVSEAQKSGQFFRAVMVGDGPLKSEVENRITFLGLQGQILLTSWVTPAELAVSGLDILMLTSFNEGTPLSILEAQACSIPIISVDAGGASESFLPGESGLLVDSRDPGVLASAIVGLLKDADQRVTMGEKGREFVSSRFRTERLVNDVNALYLELLRRKGINPK